MITRDDIRPALIASISTALGREIILNAPAGERLSNAALRAVADKLRELGLRIVPAEATEAQLKAMGDAQDRGITDIDSQYAIGVDAFADPLVEG